MPTLQSAAAKLAVTLVAVSVVGALLANGGHGDLLRLVPAETVGMGGLPFRPWQPLSYVFIASSPWEVIIGALVLWSLGGALEMRWGPRRLASFAIVTTVLAGLLTTLLALAVHSLRELAFGGSGVMVSVIWVGYGLSFGRTQINFWGIPVSGNGFALIGVGFVGLSALFGAWQVVVPEAMGLSLTYLYMRGATPRVAWLRVQNWRLQRALRGRAKHLRVVAKDRNTSSDSDRYLH
jgi:membrane associated rhomboid family serine protease